ncbi:WhiB family transcriptional regulator [Streptomyces sp. NPDC005900]|uniref:WhiB family transcriptional regulator n=1 Tax=Streptomyces sp. NPDC005900 TaxID=3154569 RepID=UPI0033EDB853
MSTATRPRAVVTGDWRRRPQPFTRSWEDRAACYNRPEAWWDGEDPAATARARQVCRTCPVLAECLAAQMRVEGCTMWNRSGLRAGLLGPERSQVFLDERAEGPFDAEEARLLALEARQSGRAVAELAVEGTSVSTLRLAGRLAEQYVPPVKPPSGTKLRGGTSLERAFQQAPVILRWRKEGMAVKNIAAEMHMSRASVEMVLRTYRVTKKRTTTRKGAAA